MNKILIVDESKVIAKLIKSSLLSETFTALDIKEENILYAADGLEAYEAIGKHKDINYVLTEVNMPNINGDELVDILVDTGKIDQVNVIFVTAETNRTSLNKDYKRNILGKITKPFNAKTFQESLAKLLNEKKNWQLQCEEMRYVWEEQGNFLTKVIGEYLKVNLPEHKTNTKEIFEIAQGFIQTEEVIPFAELIYILPIIIDEYCNKEQIDLKVDEARLSCIFKKQNYLLKKTKTKAVLYDTVHQNLERLKTKKINEALTVDKIIEFLFSAAKKKVETELAQMGSLPLIDYRIMEGFYDIALQKLEELDCRIVTESILEQKEKVSSLNNEFKQLATCKIEPNEPFCSHYQNKGGLIEAFNKNMSELSQQLLKLLAKNTALLDTLLWDEAKSSKPIFTYFDSANSFNTLTSYSLANRLLQESGVPPQYRERFKKIAAYTQKFEDRKIAMISTNFKNVDTITSVLRLANKYWSFNSFAKLEQFDKWLATNTPNILIYDVNFTIENDKSDAYAVMLNMFKPIQALKEKKAILFVSETKNSTPGENRFNDIMVINAAFNKEEFIERIKRT